MIFYLIRHGKSLANEAKLVTGTPEDNLSPEGFAQVARMKSWLEQSGFVANRHITSQWKRAQQTAHVLLPDAVWQIDPRVGETDAGIVADWPLARFLSEEPDFYSNPASRYPDGESHQELNERVLAWLYAQLASPCDAVMLVAHSGPITCILQHVLGMTMDSFPALLPAHASLSIVEICQGKYGWDRRLISFSTGSPLGLPPMMYGCSKERCR